MQHRLAWEIGRTQKVGYSSAGVVLPTTISFPEWPLPGVPAGALRRIIAVQVRARGQAPLVGAGMVQPDYMPHLL